MVLSPYAFFIVIWTSILVLVSGLEELSLIAKQLLCEALIRLDEPALVTDVLRCLWERQTMLLHQVAYNNRSAAADTCVAVDKNSAAYGKGIVDEAMACCEVLFQVGRWRVQLTDPFVGVLLRELRVKSCADGQDVGDALSAQDVLVLSRDMVPQVESLRDLIHGFYTTLFSI